MSDFQDVVFQIKLLNDRVGGHSKEMKDDISELTKKVDTMKDTQAKDKEEIIEKIHTLELRTIKDSNKMKLKIAALSGSVTLILSFASSWFRNKFGAHT